MFDAPKQAESISDFTFKPEELEGSWGLFQDKPPFFAFFKKDLEKLVFESIKPQTSLTNTFK